jgi:1-acylglycerone phosphate reductase
MLITILSPSSGFRDVIPVLDCDPERIRHTYETNIFGPMRLVQVLIPLLISARGLIVNVSSASSRVPYLFGGVYASTKSALETWSSTLRMELRPFGVRVMVSMSGTVSSTTTMRDHLPPQSLYQPARAVYERRLGYSQRASTMPSEVYARRMVADALRGEGWFGTPYECWHGGMTGIVWFVTTFFDKTFVELAVAAYFGVPKMVRMIKEARQKQE